MSIFVVNKYIITQYYFKCFVQYNKFQNNLTYFDKSAIILFVENTLALLFSFQTYKIGGRPLDHHHIGWEGG